MKIKTNLWQKISLWLGIAIALGIIFKLLTPKSTTNPNPQLTEVGGTQTQVSHFSYQGQELNIPKTLSLATAQLINTNELQLTLTQQYDLSTNPDAPNLWMGEKYSLYFDNQQAIYGLSLNQPQPVSSQLDSAKLINNAQQLLNQLLPQTTLVVDQSKTRYLSGQYQQKEVSENLAEYIELSFFQKFQDFPTYNQASLRPSALVLIDAHGQLTKLELSTQIFNFFPTNIRDTIALDQAQTNIEKGNASLLDLETNDVQPIDRSKFLSGQFYQAQIEYRVDKQLVVEPFYRFSGKLITTNNQTIQAQIITPATDY